VRASIAASPQAGTQATWVPEDFLFKQWQPEQVDLPPWSPMGGEYAGASLCATDRAQAAGLSTRPLEDTVRDILAWHRTRPAEHQEKLRAGLDPELERTTLAAWHARGKSG
jgi:2'-hydroxyisoflavone reductase